MKSPDQEWEIIQGALNLAACLHHRQSPASWKGQEKEEDFALGGKGKKGVGSGHGIRREETGRRGEVGALARGWDAECILGGGGCITDLGGQQGEAGI